MGLTGFNKRRREAALAAKKPAEKKEEPGRENPETETSVTEQKAGAKPAEKKEEPKGGKGGKKPLRDE